MSTKSDFIKGMSRMAKAYIEAALWATTDNSTSSGGYPLDKNYSIKDFTLKSLHDAQKECDSFYFRNESDLIESGLDLEQIGHDYFLSRNGHGSGFFDERGDEKILNRLQRSSRSSGESEPYVGDNGMLYWS